MCACPQKYWRYLLFFLRNNGSNESPGSMRYPKSANRSGEPIGKSSYLGSPCWPDTIMTGSGTTFAISDFQIYFTLKIRGIQKNIVIKEGTTLKIQKDEPIQLYSLYGNATRFGSRFKPGWFVDILEGRRRKSPFENTGYIYGLESRISYRLGSFANKKPKKVVE